MGSGETGGRLGENERSVAVMEPATQGSLAHPSIRELKSFHPGNIYPPPPETDITNPDLSRHYHSFLTQLLFTMTFSNE